MARKKKSEKIEEIELQIQKLMKEKEKQLEVLERSIGKMIIKHWDTYDKDDLEKVIISLADNAKELLAANEENEENSAQSNNENPTENETSATHQPTY